MNHLNSFLKLADKEISRVKTKTGKEKIHNQYIDSFFENDNEVFSDLKQREEQWQDKNRDINKLNSLFELNQQEIKNNLHHYIFDPNLNIYKTVITKPDSSKIKIEFDIEPDIEIKREYLDSITYNEKQKKIIIRLKTIYKKDDENTRLEKKTYNEKIKESILDKNLTSLLSYNNLLHIENIRFTNNTYVVKLAISLVLEPIGSFKDFIEIKIMATKATVTIKKQQKDSHPDFYNNPMYYLMKLQEKGEGDTFTKYKIFKNIYTYFTNSLASKNEKITYTPDDIADFTSHLVYKLLEKIGFFDTQRLVFADYLCGSGNLAMSFIKKIDEAKKEFNYIYLNDKNANQKIGDLLIEYLKTIWDDVSLEGLTQKEITEDNFPSLADLPNNALGFTTNEQILPNLIISNPDFNNEFKSIVFQKILEHSDPDAIYIYYYNKKLSEQAGYKLVVIKLDSINLFYDTSSILYINIYIPEAIANNIYINHYLNIPDIERYLKVYSSDLWQNKKREIVRSAFDDIVALLFDSSIVTPDFNVREDYVIVDDEIITRDRRLMKRLHLQNGKIYLDDEETIELFIGEANVDHLNFDNKSFCINYVSLNSENHYKIPVYHGDCMDIVINEYQLLKEGL